MNGHGAGRVRVSAVIIFLDACRTLCESVESVLAQDHCDLELVLVDDGSSDGSSELAKGYAQRFPDRIRYVDHPSHRNLGMSASRNLGVAVARGELIAFLDADDIWLPGKIAEQVALFDAHPGLGMAYGRTQIWHSWDPAQTGAADYFYPLGVEPDHVYPPRALLGQLIENRVQTPTTCNAMFSRAAFAAAGGFEESFRGQYEDQLFFAKLYLRSATYVASACWARYRQYADRPATTFSRPAYFGERRRLVRRLLLRALPFWGRLGARTRGLLLRDLWRAHFPQLADRLLRWQEARPQRPGPGTA